MQVKRLILIIGSLLITYSGFSQFYYGSQMEFGKNRMQYQPFNWTYFDFERYRVYLYEGGQEIAKYASYSLNRQLPIIEKRLDFQAEDKLKVLVYNNQNDFNQSNLGLITEDQYNIGGVTRIVGDKISLFFNGNHADLDRQIRAGLVELLVDQMMYGGRARDMVRNSSMLVVPDWFKNGLIAYMSEGWNSSIDNKVMDAIQNDRFSKFNQLTGKDATIAGQAFWHYVADTYGEAVIPNILYMTKISRSADNAFIFVLGNSIVNLTNEFIEVFARRYVTYSDTARVIPTAKPILEKPKSTRHYYQLKLSPDGQKVTYVTNEMNQIKVWYNTIGEKKQHRILKLGPKLERLENHTYPLLGWHPNNSIIAMIYERKNIVTLHTIDVETKETNKRNITGFEKINSFSFSNDGKKIVMSAVKKGKGQSDVFVFTINNGGVEQITNDVWDDHHPAFIKNSTGIVFESNRLHDTIKSSDDAKYDYALSKYNDIFLYNYASKSVALYRITNTPTVNEVQPIEYQKNGYIAYLSETNGIYNRYIATMDSSISFVDTTEHYRYFFTPIGVTNYSRNISEQSINQRFTRLAEVVNLNGLDYLLVSPLTNVKDIKPTSPKNTWLKSTGRSSGYDPDKIIITSPIREEEKTPSISEPKQEGVDLENYTLANEKPKVLSTNTTTTKTDVVPEKKDTILKSKSASVNEFKFPIQQNYYTSFSTDYVMSQLDNSYLSTNYQRFTGGGNPVYLNPGLNALFKIGLSDVFEDYRIVGGFRISGSLDNEYLLSWENRVRKIDQQLVLHRQSFLRVNGFYGEVAKIHTHDARYTWKIPFSEVSATKLSLLYRNDRTVYASVSDASLPKPNQYDNYAGAKAEYIYDNTIKKGLNLYNGLRLKTWVEYLRLVKEERRDLISLGFDVRHYQKIHRELIWANRLAGGSSWGTDRLIFYLGGVDNWVNPQFDRSINIVKPDQYAFQTLATNLRGFKQNIRNGNNFVAFNSEIRWPIFRYLYNKPIRSDFINNFQVVAFGDVGMAWYDKNPYSDENVNNENVYVGNPISLVIYNQKEPIIGGTGFGFRSRLLGYFIRLDFAWGIDDKKISDKRTTYLSLSTDF